MDFDFRGEVESLATVPEQFRPLYAEGEGGKAVISAPMKGIVDAIVGLNGALRNERKTSAALKGAKDVSTAVKEALGFESLDDAKRALDELTAQVAERSKVDPAKIKADIERGFQAKEQAFTAERHKMQATLERFLVDSAGLAALNEAKGNSKLLMPIIKSQAVVVPDGDDYVVRIKDVAGDYRGNGTGGFMTVADLVKEMKASADYGVAFQSDAASGGGKGTPAGGATRGAAARQERREGLSPIDKIAVGLAKRR